MLNESDTQNVLPLGYEGLSAEALVAQAHESGAEVVVDVRLNAISRKRGLSKTALAAALQAAGIRYVHLRGLGNPKDNRAAFVSGNPAARARFVELPQSGDGERDLATLRDLTANNRVALLCFEHDPATCHRTVVAQQL